MAVRSFLRSQLSERKKYTSMLAGNDPLFPSGIAGYVAGGAGDTTGVEKFLFPNDTRTVLASTLNTGKSLAAGFSNPAVAGYVAGGSEASVQKVTFVTDATSQLGTGLSSSRGYPAAFENPTVAGYVAGGSSQTAVDKFAFPADSRSTLGTGLSSANNVILGGFSNFDVAGYVAGGLLLDDSSTNRVDKFAFPSDAKSTLGTGLSSGRDGVSGFNNSGTAGYVAGGGVLVGGTRFDTVDKFAFPSDTRSTLATGLSAARRDVAGFNSNTHGYVAGGKEGTNVSTVEKFEFSTDSRSATTSLSQSRRYAAGFENL